MTILNEAWKLESGTGEIVTVDTLSRVIQVGNKETAERIIEDHNHCLMVRRAT